MSTPVSAKRKALFSANATPTSEAYARNSNEKNNADFIPFSTPLRQTQTQISYISLSPTRFFTPRTAASTAPPPSATKLESALKRLISDDAKQSLNKQLESTPISNTTKTFDSTPNNSNTSFDGRWENPKLHEVETLQRNLNFTDLDSLRLVWNSFGLIVLLFAYVGGYV
ncbi:hypothetical protein HK100_009763, partial [Physocladia obscura]